MNTEIFHLKLGLNSSYLIRGKDIVMVDAGTPNQLEAFKKVLSKLRIRPEEIRLIVLTHSHFDHCGSVRDIRDLTGAAIAIHESEASYLEKEGMLMPKGVGMYGKITKPLLFPFLKRIRFPRVTPDILIKNEPYPLTEYGIEGRIIHTPGHTIGSLSVILDSGEAFVGCMAHNGFPFRLSPGLPIYAQDIEKIRNNWRNLFPQGVKMVYPGHGNPFPVEIMKRSLS